MVELRIKMKTGEIFFQRINGSVQDARQMIEGKPFIELNYDNGFVILNISEVALVSCAEVSDDQPDKNIHSRTSDESIASS